MAQAYVTLPIGFQRVNAVPFNNDQVFTTLAAAQTYAAGSDPTLGPIAYPGQVLSVTESGENYGVYFITADMQLQKVGADQGAKAVAYAINLASLTSEQTSENIAEAIGGFENLVTAYDTHVPIIGYTGSTTRGTLMAVMANKGAEGNALTMYFFGYEAGFKVWIYEVTNTDGTLSVTMAGSTTEMARKTDIPTNISQLENDSDFQTSTEVSKSISQAVSALGNVFTLKGRVDNEEALPQEGNKAGDVYLVGTAGSAEFEEMVWVVDGDDAHWELLGRVSIDLSLYLTKAEAEELYAKKADGITAEEREKLSKIKTDGDGTKVLSDAGTYIDLPTPETGVSDYGQLTGKPKLNSVEINGEQTSEDLNINTDTTKTTEAIEVKLGANGAAGGYKTGDNIAEGTAITTILKKLFQKQEPPVYAKPTLGLSGDGTTPVECGTVQSLKLTPTFTQKDGGALTGYTLKRGEETLIDGDSSASAYTDEDVTIPDGSITYTATATYGQGPVKNDNLGQPYPTGQIQAGSVSATKTYQGRRHCFWAASVNDIAHATSANIRAMSGTGYIANGGKMTITIPQGCKYVCFAVPASYGDPSSVISAAAPGFNIVDGFLTGKTTVQVEGVNGYSPIAYNVYYQASDSGQNATSYEVTI